MSPLNNANIFSNEMLRSILHLIQRLVFHPLPEVVILVPEVANQQEVNYQLSFKI